ncbi:hypothetical protein M9H77_16445 [Catharanthus roseus]|uniref:Uncharacterized protein n=1 Tax=Catharanthus roseus TaxID=4058 RepID=A0ACC0B1Y3_CATRO|nr:hypothetical protein M9H77_16445 [Catharanthus roseus]
MILFLLIPLHGNQSNPKKRGRGPSKDITLKEGQVIQVEFSDQMQPIGKSKNTFMTYLGHITHNDTTSASAYRINSMKSLGKRWRGWKSSIKRKFFCGRSKEEALAVAEINKRNWSMHGAPHRCARKAFAIIREENSTKERLKEFPDEEQTVALRNRIFKEFMGPTGHGYMRIMGLVQLPHRCVGKQAHLKTRLMSL